MSDKKILDVTCGSRTIWFDKKHPAAVYCDIRKEELTGIWKSESGQSERTCASEICRSNRLAGKEVWKAGRTLAGNVT